MTCIVAMIKDNIVYMGGESAGTNEYFHQNLRRDSKVFRKGDMVIGFTSSFRMGSILRYKFVVPDKPTNQTIDEYMNTTFIDAVRKLFKVEGFATIENNSESGGNFLVGYKGRIFVIEEDYQIGESLEPFFAVGCGAQLALGALSAMYESDWDNPRILEIALNAACKYNAGCRGPFNYVNTIGG